MTSSKNPRVTVIMPVFNGERFLADAIRSVLAQTFRDFELLVIDGGSSDTSVQIARGFDDARMRVVAHEPRFSLTESLNEGLDLARGEYVARMDADDLALPERLERQVQFMDANPDLAVGASFAIEFGRDRNKLYSFPTERRETRAFSLFECPIAHPTVVFRKSILDRHGLRYSREFNVCEDWELWLRILDVAEIGVLPLPLLLYRYHDGSVTRQHLQRLHEKSLILDRRSLQKLGLGDHPLIRYHRLLSLAHMRRTLEGAFEPKDLEAWITALVKANDQRGIYDSQALRQQILTRFLKMAALDRQLLWRLPRLSWLLGFGMRTYAGTIMGISRRLRGGRRTVSIALQKVASQGS